MNRVLLVFFLCTLSACAEIPAPAMTPASAAPCRGSALRWVAPEDADHRARLDTWCAGVGPPALQPLPLADARVAMEDVTFVSWNVHVGNGDIRRMVTDLRAGALTGGRPVRQFVLMLQEAVRAEGVPSYAAAAAGAARIRARDPQDVVQVSRDLRLALIYVPSMRNGNAPGDPATDRGSAILSTIALQEPIAIELPGERQRRVVIVASIAQRDGTPWSVGAIHLDALGSARRLWLFWTPWMREMQVRALASVLPPGPLVLGADLNTWHGKDERAARVLGRMFARTPVSLDRHGLGLRVLDYLFFRAPANRRARYFEAKSAYGSDHHPLIGWIE